MIYSLLSLTIVLMLAAIPASAREISSLADCANKVFAEINRTQKWSGKPPNGCQARVAVEKRPSGVFVAVWAFEHAESGWTMTAFSGAMDYSEIADKKELALAGKDIMARAVRLERCLNSITTVNDPLECLDRATRSYHVGEEIGSGTRRLVWLNDNGRHAVVQYGSGAASTVQAPPADLFNGESVRPGMAVNLHLKLK